MTFRGYAELTGPSRSDLPGQVAAQRDAVRHRLADVRRVVAVMSGKGGVGKSHVTAALADGLAGGGAWRVGVVDADLKSPTVARTLEATTPLVVAKEGVEPAQGRHGIRVVSTDLLLPEDQPLRWREPGSDQFIWRGTLEAAVVREFLADVRWGELDLLLVDLPPGADGVADIKTLVPGLTGVLLVTIPTEEARRSVMRAARAAADADIRLLGVIENMSGYRCRDCGTTRPLFPGQAGAEIATAYGIPLLARLPFAADIAVTDEAGEMVAAVRECIE